MTMTLHLHRVSRRCVDICEHMAGAANLRDDDGHSLLMRLPWWIAGRTMQRRDRRAPTSGDRLIPPYRRAARAALAIGLRFVEMGNEAIGADDGERPEDVMATVFARCFLLDPKSIPVVAPPCRQTDAYDKQRALLDSLDRCGDHLRDVERVRCMLRLAQTMIIGSWPLKKTIGATFDAAGDSFRSLRMFFDPAGELLSDAVLRFEHCDATPFWPGLLEHAAVFHPHDELRSTPWVGDVANVAAKLRAEPGEVVPVRFPYAEMKARMRGAM